jgi:photosystem II stability/assembly factor-like uncharacterized protein
MKENNMKNIYYLFAVCILIFSSIVNAQWVVDSIGIGNVSVRSLAYSGNNIFAGTINYGVYVSTNNGTSWNKTSLDDQFIYSLAVDGSNVFAGTYGNGIYLSTNNGTTWTQTSLIDQYVPSLAVSGTNIFAGVYYSGLYLSTDNGTSWSQTSLNSGDVYSLSVSGTNIFAGTYLNGVYYSTNNGITWTQTSLNNQTIYSLLIDGNNIYAGTYYSSGVYLSTDIGTSWAQTTLNNRSVYSFAINGNNILAGTDGYGVYLSTNNGTSWVQRNEGLEGVGVPFIYAFCITNNYIFIGTGNSVYKRSLDELTDVQSTSNELPKQFSLAQNFPNPFNTSTTIHFSVPSSEFVTLKVFDVSGNEVATLINEEKPAGSYEVNFNASQLTSGVYFYTINAGSFIETKKMILMK